VFWSLLIVKLTSSLATTPKTCCLIYYRKCTVPFVASNGKHGSCPQGTFF